MVGWGDCEVLGKFLRWISGWRRPESTVTTTGHSGRAGVGEYTIFLSLSRHVSGVIRSLSRFAGWLRVLLYAHVRVNINVIGALFLATTVRIFNI